jgi:hypothetical protein
MFNIFAISWLLCMFIIYSDKCSIRSLIFSAIILIGVINIYFDNEYDENKYYKNEYYKNKYYKNEYYKKNKRCNIKREQEIDDNFIKEADEFFKKF